MNNKIIIQHQVKTGGESIRKLMRQYISNKDFLIINDDAFHKINITEFDQISYYMGHCKYNVHKELKFKNYKYITVLRDPVERVISYYSYIKHRPIDPHYKMAQKLTLKEFVDYNAQMRNGQFRKITSNNKFDFEECIENIEKDYMFIGIFKYFNETMRYIAKILNIHHFNIPHENINSNKLLMSDIDKETINYIIKHNESDIKLYNLMLKKYSYYKEKIDILY